MELNNSTVFLIWFIKPNIYNKFWFVKPNIYILIYNYF